MSKFVIEPNKIYDVNFCSNRLFIFGSFAFDDSLEADEGVEYEEA